MVVNIHVLNLLSCWILSFTTHLPIFHPINLQEKKFSRDQQMEMV